MGVGVADMRCGKTITQKKIVPMSIQEAKIPNCRKAGECKGIRVKKAPAVVILPMIRGDKTSSSVCRTEEV